MLINLRSAECVCSYYGLRVCSQTNKLNYQHVFKLAGDIKYFSQKLLYTIFLYQITGSHIFKKMGNLTYSGLFCWKAFSLVLIGGKD